MNRMDMNGSIPFNDSILVLSWFEPQPYLNLPPAYRITHYTKILEKLLSKSKVVKKQRKDHERLEKSKKMTE